MRALQLTEQLVAQPSITPFDADCQKILAKRLEVLGFECETLIFGDVTNLWAKRTSSKSDSKSIASSSIPTLVFAGHTDVVPTGPIKQWGSDPFTPTHRNGKLYGRGTSDMKAPIAAFIVALEEFIAAQEAKSEAIALNLALLITSDEEGVAVDGTVRVCEVLKKRQERLDYCIVGEPTAVKQSGDMIKNGRRGSLSGKLTIHGIQGHIAYPQLARNPIHLALPALDELCKTVWDSGNAFFPATSFQISNLHSGTGAGNVIPGSAVIDFNFRFSTQSTPEQLQQRVQSVLDRHELSYDLKWTLGGLPFVTEVGSLVDAVCQAIKDETGLKTELSTTGGTSDGRFIAQICPQVVEVGPPNASIHQIDEHIALTDLESIQNIYRRILENLNQKHL